MIYILIVIINGIVAAFAGFLFKKGSNNANLLQMIKNPYLYAGGFLYILSAILAIIVLRFLPYSIVMPLGGITYIWTMLISFFLLKEKLTYRKIIGIISILIGAIFIVL